MRSRYEHDLKNAAKYCRKYGKEDTLYNHFKGLVHGYGDVLDYDFDRIEKDIADAIEQYQPEERLREA